MLDFLHLVVSNSYVWGLDFFTFLGLQIVRFGGYKFLRLGDTNSYVLRLDFLRFGVKNSYV